MERWNIVSTLNYLPFEKELEIILSKNKKFNNKEGKEILSNMIKVADLTRKGFVNGDISTVMSPRTVLHWAENTTIFKDQGYAFRVTFLNKCDELEKKIISENFKTAIGSTVKSLSNLENVEVSFGNQNLNSEKAKVKLPEIELIDNKINYNQIRAIADSKSLNIRYSDLDTLKSFEPEGNISKKLYNLAEKIRCEKLGSDQFKGIKNNISKIFIVINSYHI